MPDIESAIILAATKAAKADATAALSTLARIQALTDELTLDYVAQARREGRTWEQIGTVLGTTRQAAHERYAHLV